MKLKVITLSLLSLLCLNAEAQPFHLYKLSNNQGITMTVTDYGARIVSLCVPDKDWKSEDIVCGYDTLESYAKYKQNYGAIVGRYIGRILGAQFTLDGTTYHLDAESNGHCSHGGKPGVANRTWRLIPSKVSKYRNIELSNHRLFDFPNSLSLQYISPDGESGFPGELTLTVTYTLTDNNELRIDYEATTTKPTVLNPSNHSFFNISGNFNNTVLNQQLMIDADSIALYDSKKCVTGALASVKNTPFDFLTPQAIGSRIDDDDPQLKVTGGYDHSYRLNHSGDINHVAARIYDPTSGRVMEVMTTEPVLQIYSGNGLKANSIGKDGIAYARRSAICFETMHYADSPNKPHWPSTVLRPGETYRSTTIYKFSAEHETESQKSLSQTSSIPSIQSGYIPVSQDGKIYYETYGKGAPVVLIHGHSLDRRMWRKQIEALAPHYKVIVLDVRGYGRSSRLREDLHTTHADDIITLMDSLHIDKAHIIGLSMGGFIAADMLCMYPDRMLSCVMSSGSLRNMNGPSTPLDSLEIAKQDKKIRDALHNGIDQTRKDWIEQLIKGGGSQAENMRNELTAIINDWDCWSLLHHEPHLWYAQEAKPYLEQRKPAVPTLFLSGDKENKKRSSMMKSLPNSDFKVIPDCGHMSNMERPEEFNKIILDFLSKAQ